MSHLLSRKGDKYKVWSTVSDGYLMDKWLTEAELKSWMVKQAERNYKRSLVEKLWLFPSGWATKKREVFFADRTAIEGHYQWGMTLCSRKTEEEYDKMLDEKLAELTKGLPDFYSF